MAGVCNQIRSYAPVNSDPNVRSVVTSSIYKSLIVVAIDSNRDELLEAADGPLKIVMDATRLEFLDESFNIVTAFFSLMYMTASDHKGVFSEVFRVLKDKGVFRIWDIQLTQPADTKKLGFAVPVEVV